MDYQRKFEEMSDKVSSMNHASICKAMLYRDSQIEELIRKLSLVEEKMYSVNEIKPSVD